MSKIEWTNKTWNPIIGCEKISEGCKNCYAEKMAYRLAHIESTRHKYQEVVKTRPIGWNGQIMLDADSLEKPLQWKKPKKIFVCSMGDLFHDSVKYEHIEEVIRIIQLCPQHTFQILTKRPKNMRKFFDYFYYGGWKYCTRIPIKNLHLGVTAENQKRAEERIPILLDIPAAKRFISCEPLLSKIDFEFGSVENGYTNTLTGNVFCPGMNEPTKIKGLDWVICGPETGPRARPMQKEWIENIYNQCKAANVPLFDKKDTLGLNLKQFPNEQ